MNTKALTLSLLLGAAASRVFASDVCDHPAVVDPLDLDSFLGRWYEIAHDAGPYEGGDCVTADYSLNDDGSIKVFNSEVLDGELSSITGQATCQGTSGQCCVEFYAPFCADYEVIEVVYDQYALLYSCRPLPKNQGANTSVWILSREPELDSGILSHLEDVITQKMPNFDLTSIQMTKQGGDCTYVDTQ